MPGPAHYTVELATPAEGWSHLEQLTARARRAAEELRDEGLQVRFLRSIFVPEDDACFLLYEASAESAVLEAVRRARLGSAQSRPAVVVPALDEAEG